MSVVLILALVGVGLLAFTVEAAVGFGSTVLAAAIGAQFLPLDALLPAFVPINMLLSFWILGRHRHLVAWRVLVLEAAPPLVVGAAAGLALAHLDSRLLLQLGFAVVVIGMAALELGRLVAAPVEDAQPLARPVRLALLALGGVAHGLFGTGGPMIVYVLRRRIPDKGAFRATLATIWIVLNTALLVNFSSLHLYGTHTLAIAGTLAATIVPATFLGNWLHHRLDARAFQRAVCVLLLIAGLLLALRTGVQLAR